MTSLVCVFCGEQNLFGDGVIPVTNGGLCLDQYSCKKCTYKVFPAASAEVQLFVQHIEENMGGALSRDAGARGLWLAIKYYFKNKGLL